MSSTPVRSTSLLHLTEAVNMSGEWATLTTQTRGLTAQLTAEGLEVKSTTALMKDTTFKDPRLELRLEPNLRELFEGLHDPVPGAQLHTEPTASLAHLSLHLKAKVIILIVQGMEFGKDSSITSLTNLEEHRVTLTLALIFPHPRPNQRYLLCLQSPL
jgi:hypothetical protein